MSIEGFSEEEKARGECYFILTGLVFGLGGVNREEFLNKALANQSASMLLEKLLSESRSANMIIDDGQRFAHIQAFLEREGLKPRRGKPTD